MLVIPIYYQFMYLKHLLNHDKYTELIWESKRDYLLSIPHCVEQISCEWMAGTIYIKEYLVKFTMNLHVQWSRYCNIFSLNYRGSIFVCEQRVLRWNCHYVFHNFGLSHTELEHPTPTCERNTLQRASSSRFDPKI